MKRILGLCLVTGLLLCQIVSVANAQEKIRIIQQLQPENSPVVVVNRRVGERLVDRKSENRYGIVAGHNWLNELSFDVKNITNKSVTYIDLQLDIPKSGKMERNGMVVSFIFGNRAASVTTTHKDSSRLLELLKPGEVVKLKISELVREKLEAYLKKYDAEDVEQIRVDIREVHFDDGTGWYLGHELKQDPSNPKIWRSVGQGQMKKPSFSSVWMAAFVPIPFPNFLGGYRSLSIPARCRNFFVSAPTNPPTSPTCGYVGGPKPPIPCASGCVATEDTDHCEQPDEGGNTCVPPECLACKMNGGTSCINGNCWTPVLIDVLGNGFDLTNLENGIRFRPEPGAETIKTSWTTAGNDDAWLVLDRNGNGSIDDATELFGCATLQPDPEPGRIGNGFIALAEFDKVSNGGNGDGLISKDDDVFNRLRLWRDSNHDGRSRNSELFRLRDLGLRKIDLDFQESRRTDEHGNKFKYRARVKDANDAQLGRWAFDVFLLSGD